jgi:hypothetical protein
MNVLSRGFIPPEDVAKVEREPIAMIRSHITWGGVIGGSVLTFGLLALSCSFATACGLPVVAGDGTYGFGAGLWSIITAIIAFGSGGWLGACLASTINARYRVLHGVMVWALTIGLIVLLSEGGASMLVGRNVGLISGIREMVLVAPRIGPAWGAFISLAVGLAAAICGGALPDLFLREDIGRTRIADESEGI